MTSCAKAGCFVPDTDLPEREAVLAAVDHGQGGRELMDAVFHGDRGSVARLLSHDAQLVRASDRRHADVLSVAIARCDREMVDLLLRHGASPEGPNREGPLGLAIRATTPWFAERLLDAGAKADWPEPDRPSLLYEAIFIGSKGAVRLLLDHGAPVNGRDTAGATPLKIAVAAGRFEIAEVLIERGADPLSSDVAGGTPANVIARAPRRDAAEAAARDRVLARLRALEVLPAIPPDEVRRRVLAGRWPAQGARGEPPSAQVVATMRANWNPDGTRRGR